MSSTIFTNFAFRRRVMPPAQRALSRPRAARLLGLDSALQWEDTGGMCRQCLRAAPVPAAAEPQASRPPRPPAGARGGGELGESFSRGNGRGTLGRSPNLQPKRAGAQPGTSARSARTPPPARPERPEAAPPPEQAAGTAGRRSGGTRGRARAPQRPRPRGGAAEEAPKDGGGGRRAPRRTRKSVQGFRGADQPRPRRGQRPRRPTAKSRAPAQPTRGAKRRRAAEGEPQRLKRAAAR